MEYRTFGRLAWQPSALGFGAMRLPVIDDEPSNIDEPEAISMIRYAVDHGVNYVDTAYPYHGGKSEGLLGRALEDGYRAKVKVATKSPAWLLEKPDDFRRYLEEQIGRLATGPIDFYLLHSLDRERWAKVRELGVLEAAEQAMSEGLFTHFGFSFHDSAAAFKEIVDGYDGWEFCQIQYNYMDTEFQAGADGLRYASERGLGVVVMEPLRGGALAVPPDAVRSLWADAGTRRSPAEWALQWLWDQPEVSLVLSGMSTMAQVRENVESAARSSRERLGPADRILAERIRATYHQLGWIPCTTCRYCVPCPHGVDIPASFDLYNALMAPEKQDRLRQWYSRWPEERRAGACRACGECEEKCPQNLPIRELLEKAHAALGPGAAAPAAG